MARIKRFTPVQRVFHLLLMLSFVMQATTGLSRMYIKTAWGRFLASLFGGYDTALSIHVAVGIFMLALFISHIVYLAVKIDWRGFPKSVYGPDSLLPRLEDGRQILQHIGWMPHEGGNKEMPKDTEPKRPYLVVLNSSLKSS